MDPKQRYSLCPPVDGGLRWWEITDTKLDFAVVTVFADSPHAEEIARAAYELITKEK